LHDLHALHVLHVATHEHTGAGRAAARTHAAMSKAGVRSELLVLHGTAAEPGIEVLGGKPRHIVADLRLRAENALLSLQDDGDGNGTFRSLGFAGPGLAAIRRKKPGPDLIHLHWIPGLLGIPDLPVLGRPVVWTFHDQWPICGAEHYTELARPRLGYDAGNRGPGARGPDLDRWTWERKRAAWASFAPTIVCSSRWMAGEVRASRMFGGRDADNVHILPNPLDTGLYCPLERAAARHHFGLPEDRKLLLFGAWGATTDRRKGFHVLSEALKQLSASGLAADTDLVLFGVSGIAAVQGFRTHSLGVIDTEAALRQLYSACDVLAIPSLQDNLPNILAEAMACGLPAVGSDTGGIPDLIRHGETGLLAAPGDAAQLADRLQLLLNDDALRARIRTAARRAIEEACGESSVAARYLEIYRKAMAS
jgi:glycosyltransferase involved in cell wall biosynthesis